MIYIWFNHPQSGHQYQDTNTRIPGYQDINPTNHRPATINRHDDYTKRYYAKYDYDDHDGYAKCEYAEKTWNGYAKCLSSPSHTS